VLSLRKAWPVFADKSLPGHNILVLFSAKRKFTGRYSLVTVVYLDGDALVCFSFFLESYIEFYKGPHVDLFH